MLAISPDGPVIADACSRDDRRRRMRLLPLDGQPPSPSWPVPVSWQHRHDIALGGAGPPPSGSDIEVG
jgi:hypothetical protein